MSGDTALVIAIVGVFGTLAATIIGQYFASKSRRTELAYQDKARKDEGNTMTIRLYLKSSDPVISSSWPRREIIEWRY
jgi:hypothetical protein